MNNLSKIHPEVDAVIRPIVAEMTKINIEQLRTPDYMSGSKEPDYNKEMKKRCVHIIYDYTTNEYRLAVKYNETSGKLECQACGRAFPVKFNKETNCDKILEAIEAIDQILFFSMLNNLKAGPIKTMIDLKTVLPEVAKLGKELNDFVKSEEKVNNTSKNLGAEYGTITSFMNGTGLI